MGSAVELCRQTIVLMCCRTNISRHFMMCDQTVVIEATDGILLWQWDDCGRFQLRWDDGVGQGKIVSMGINR